MRLRPTKKNVELIREKIIYDFPDKLCGNTWYNPKNGLRCAVAYIDDTVQEHMSGILPDRMWGENTIYSVVGVPRDMMDWNDRLHVNHEERARRLKKKLAGIWGVPI